MAQVQGGKQRDHNTLIYVFLGSANTISSLALQLLKIALLDTSSKWLNLHWSLQHGVPKVLLIAHLKLMFSRFLFGS